MEGVSPRRYRALKTELGNVAIPMPLKIVLQREKSVLAGEIPAQYGHFYIVLSTVPVAICFTVKVWLLCLRQSYQY